MKEEISKRMRGKLRHWGGIAHERELRQMLEELSRSFARWQKEEIDTWKLVEEVDRFATGQQRRRWDKSYNTNNIIHMMVAQAIVRGLLSEAEVPGDVLAALEKPIEYYRDGLADGSVSFDDED